LAASCKPGGGLELPKSCAPGGGESGSAIRHAFAQGLRSSLSHQILELAKTHGEIKVKEIEEFTGANRNTIKVHVKKLANDNYLTQVGKGRGARYTLK